MRVTPDSNKTDAFVVLSKSITVRRALPWPPNKLFYKYALVILLFVRRTRILAKLKTSKSVLVTSYLSTKRSENVNYYKMTLVKKFVGWPR